MTKYGAVRTKVDGYTFASKAEAKRYGELRLLEKANLISDIKVHPEYPIIIKGKKVCRVILDFAYVASDEVHVEDVKGRDNPYSRLKRKLFEAEYGIDVELIKA